MKSGLEDRNNQYIAGTSGQWGDNRLNEVRPGRPEQSARNKMPSPSDIHVSMKSGLEDRNNMSMS